MDHSVMFHLTQTHSNSSRQSNTQVKDTCDTWRNSIMKCGTGLTPQVPNRQSVSKDLAPYSSKLNLKWNHDGVQIHSHVEINLLAKIRGFPALTKQMWTNKVKDIVSFQIQCGDVKRNCPNIGNIRQLPVSLCAQEIITHIIARW